MRASRIVALSAVSLALFSTAAWAEDTTDSQVESVNGSTVTLKVVKIKGRRTHPQASVDINRLVPRAPLPELRQPLIDRIAAATEKDPF